MIPRITIQKYICFMFSYNVEYSSINGNWYKSFFVVTFNLWKFMQIYNFPFLFSTSTIGESHVVSSAGYIKPTVNNLLMFYLIIIT